MSAEKLSFSLIDSKVFEDKCKNDDFLLGQQAKATKYIHQFCNKCITEEVFGGMRTCFKEKPH